MAFWARRRRASPFEAAKPVRSSRLTRSSSSAAGIALEGTSSAAAIEKWPSREYPGAESILSVVERGRAGLARIAHDYPDQDVVIVCHGTIIRYTLAALAGHSVDGIAADAQVKSTLEAFGKVDILVNNAGITRDDLIMRMSMEAWRDVLETNLFGAFYAIKAVTRPMLKARSGRIVNITSVSGQAGQTGQANYSAAKAGLIGLTKATARELASRGITCNAVAPGFVLTELTQDLPEALQTEITARTPLGRFGTTEEIANAVAFLASDEAAFITGQVLAVDGGLVMM